MTSKAVCYPARFMEMRKENLFRLRVAMGVLVALVGLMGVSDFLPHTDDGCAVEIHCLTCRAHISAVTDLVTFASLPLGPSAISAFERSADPGPKDAPVRLLPPGRAPPASALSLIHISEPTRPY